MKYKLVIASIICVLNIAIGQESELKIEDVSVIKDFDVQIADFNKINIDPALPSFDIKSRIYEYKVRPLPVKLDYEKPKIRPLALKPESIEDPNKYYLKVGYGIPKMFDMAASAGFNVSGIEGFVKSDYIGADNSKNSYNQKYSKTGFDVSLLKNDFTKEMKYGIKANFTNTYNYLYSDIPSVELPAENLRRRYLLMGFEGLFEKSNIKNTIKNNLKAGVEVLQFNAGNFNETELDIDDKFNYDLNSNSKITVPINFTNILGSKDLIILLQPHYLYSSKLINVKFGASLGISQEKNLLRPYTQISSNLFHNFLEIYAGYDSDFFNNTSITKLNINPFINFEDENIKTTKSDYIFAGVRNSLEGALIEIKGTYVIFKDLHFFKINPIDSMTFNSIYDNGTNLKLEARVSYKPIGNFEIGGSVVKNFYNLESLEHAFYTPDFEINAFTKIRLFKNKLIVRGELYTGSAPWYQDLQGNSKKLDPLFDLNGSAEFNLSKSISVFAEINNIFAQKYKKWYGYDNFGINLIGGLKAVF